MRCAPEATTTTRSRTWGSSRLVSAKWPRWFVPSCISKPSLVRLLGHGHHAGVVDEDVEVALPRVGEGVDGGEVGEVELAHLGLAVDGGRGRLALGDVADGEHDAGAGAAELASGGEADAAVGAGDDEGASIEAGKILCGPFGGGGHVRQSSW